jgi:hypothetical protein
MNAAEKKQVVSEKKSEISRKIWCVVYWILALACGIAGTFVLVVFTKLSNGRAAILTLLSIPYFALCVFFVNQAKKALEKNGDPVEESDRRYLKHIGAINESFVKKGAKSAYQTLLSSLGNEKINFIQVFPWLVDTVLDKGAISAEDQASLEEFVEISRIATMEIPYPQKERILKSLIVSKIPCEQKEWMTKTPFLSGAPNGKGHTGERGDTEPAKKTGGDLFSVFVSWGVCIFLFLLGSISFYAVLYTSEIIFLFLLVIPIPLGFIVLGVHFAKRGNEMLKENRRRAFEKTYSERAILIKDSFTENGAEGAYANNLSVVLHDKAEAKKNAIQALPLIADTLLGKDALTPEDRASFIKFMEISGVDSSQIPDELKERIVQSFLLSKIPYEQKEGLLRPIILRAKSNATALGGDTRMRVDDGS